MARQLGVVNLKGKLLDRTFFERKGKFYCKKNTSLNRERLYTDPCFAKARKNFTLFGRAAKLASVVYWQLPESKRRHKVIRKLIGEIQLQLLAGKGEKRILEYMLEKHCTEPKGLSCQSFKLSTPSTAMQHPNSIDIKEQQPYRIKGSFNNCQFDIVLPLSASCNIKPPPKLKPPLTWLQS